LLYAAYVSYIINEYGMVWYCMVWYGMEQNTPMHALDIILW